MEIIHNLSMPAINVMQIWWKRHFSWLPVLCSLRSATATTRHRAAWCCVDTSNRTWTRRTWWTGEKKKHSLLNILLGQLCCVSITLFQNLHHHLRRLRHHFGCPQGTMHHRRIRCWLEHQVAQPASGNWKYI